MDQARKQLHESLQPYLLRLQDVRQSACSQNINFGVPEKLSVDHRISNGKDALMFAEGKILFHAFVYRISSHGCITDTLLFQKALEAYRNNEFDVLYQCTKDIQSGQVGALMDSSADSAVSCSLDGLLADCRALVYCIEALENKISRIQGDLLCRLYCQGEQVFDRFIDKKIQQVERDITRWKRLLRKK